MKNTALVSFGRLGNVGKIGNRRYEEAFALIKCEEGTFLLHFFGNYYWSDRFEPRGAYAYKVLGRSLRKKLSKRLVPVGAWDRRAHRGHADRFDFRTGAKGYRRAYITVVVRNEVSAHYGDSCLLGSYGDITNIDTGREALNVGRLPRFNEPNLEWYNEELPLWEQR